MKQSINKQRLTPYLLLLPVVLFLLVVYAYPLALTFRYAFQKVSLIGPDSEWLGFANFVRIFRDEDFYKTLFLTAKWTVLTVSLKIGCGFFLALLLKGKLYFRKGLQFMVLIPWAIPQVVVSILWQWILDSQYGYLNYFLQSFGISDKAVFWLSEPNLALFSAAVVDAWIGIPLICMIFLSGLNAVPEEIYEAAEVDGADRWQRFLHITLPAIKPVFFIALTLTTIWTFNAFNTIYVLTGGGPMGATETVMLKIYHEAFGKYNMGMSSALSLVVFVILLSLSVLYWKQISKEDA